MANRRVYEIAKELKVDTSVVISTLREMGVPVKTHASAVADEYVPKLRESILGPGQREVVDKKVKSGVIRRRVRKIDTPKEAPPAPGPKAVAADPASPAPAADPAPPAAQTAPQAAAEPVAEPAPAPTRRRPPRSPEPEAPVAPPPPPPEEAPQKRRKSKKGSDQRDTLPRKKEYITKRDMYESSSRMYRPARRKKKVLPRAGMRKTEVTQPGLAKRKLKIGDTIAVADLAHRMGLKSREVLRHLHSLGVDAVESTAIPFDEATLVATEFGFETESALVDEREYFKDVAEQDDARVARAPVVTVMGHVDHGKTSLLDAIRETTVVEGEHGGITQHIGAYTVSLDQGAVTFIDTPGHAAFTSMRARGASATDIVVLVVAANDGVMPQTIESINHAKAAKVPIVVAVNKVDLPDANVDRVKSQLSEREVVADDWGGDVPFIEVSALKKQNLDKLLETILLVAELQELKGNPKRPVEGVVLESRLDKGRGPVATILVREGTLNKGTALVSGMITGKVRSMMDFRGQQVKTAGPSTAVEVTGLSSPPTPGDVIREVKSERDARKVAGLREDRAKEESQAALQEPDVDAIYAQMGLAQAKELTLILKADVQGSVEALGAALTNLSTDKCKLTLLHSGIGGITENDVNLAQASGAMVIGFNVRPEPGVQKQAERADVPLRMYNVIYEAIDDVKKAMEGLLEPEYKEEIVGHAEVKEIFSIPRVGSIAGSLVTDGKIVSNAHVRLIRDSVNVFDGMLGSLRRFQDDVREVPAGTECGIRIQNYNDVKPGDIIEAYVREETRPSL